MPAKNAGMQSPYTVALEFIVQGAAADTENLCRLLTVIPGGAQRADDYFALHFL